MAVATACMVGRISFAAIDAPVKLATQTIAPETAGPPTNLLNPTILVHLTIFQWLVIVSHIPHEGDTIPGADKHPPPFQVHPEDYIQLDYVTPRVKL